MRLTEIFLISSDCSRENARPPVADGIGLVYPAIAHQGHSPAVMRLAQEDIELKEVQTVLRLWKDFVHARTIKNKNFWWSMRQN